MFGCPKQPLCPHRAGRIRTLSEEFWPESSRSQAGSLGRPQAAGVRDRRCGAARDHNKAPQHPRPKPSARSDRWADPRHAKMSDRPPPSPLLVLVLCRPACKGSQRLRPGRGYDRPALVRVRESDISVSSEWEALEATVWSQGGWKVFTKPSPSRRVGAAMRSDPRALLVLAGVARAAVAVPALRRKYLRAGWLFGFLLCL